VRPAETRSARIPCGPSAREPAASKTVTRAPRPSAPPRWCAVDEAAGDAGVSRRNAGHAGGGEAAEPEALADPEHDHPGRRPRQPDGERRDGEQADPEHERGSRRTSRPAGRRRTERGSRGDDVTPPSRAAPHHPFPDPGVSGAACTTSAPRRRGAVAAGRRARPAPRRPRWVLTSSWMGAAGSRAGRRRCR
jgi:hypothetical protein